MPSPAGEGDTIRSHLTWTRSRLTAAGISDASIEAELLLRKALQGTRDELLTRSFLYQRLDQALEPGAVAALASLVARRLNREPSAYITGERHFRGLRFEVTPDVLIPRPETEMLTEHSLVLLRERGACAPPARVVDVGTGSGAIAVSVAVEEPRAVVFATDMSGAALDVARRNARRHAVGRRVRFLHGDLLLPLSFYVDLIVANLPYVTTSDWAALEPELRDHEPRLALDGGSDGLALIRSLLHQAPHYLRRNGAIVLEFGVGQRDALLASAEAALPGASLQVIDDFAGIPRVLVARLP